MMENTTTTMITTTPQTFTQAIEPAIEIDAPIEQTVELSATAAAERKETQAWKLAAELRGSLNALGLCVRVLETAPNDAEAREYVRHITAAAQRIERLIAKRHLAKSA